MEDHDKKIYINGVELGKELAETLNHLLAPVAEMEMLKRKELLTEKEVSLLYSVPRDSLRTERCRGRGPIYVKDGKRVLYPARELAVYFERRLVKTRG
jgi:hypothetical protein